MEERGMVWTEEEVRKRLKRYNEDDALSDCRIARPSQICIAHTASSDRMPRLVYRILKRVELEMAIRDALLPMGKPVTKEQKRKKRLYHVIRLVYIVDMGMAETAEVMDVDRSTVYRWEGEAVGLSAGWLNRREERVRAV